VEHDCTDAGGRVALGAVTELSRCTSVVGGMMPRATAESGLLTGVPCTPDPSILLEESRGLVIRGPCVAFLAQSRLLPFRFAVQATYA
jgi:hypothetical protein